MAKVSEKVLTFNDGSRSGIARSNSKTKRIPMRQFLIISAFIAAIIAVVLAVTHLYHLAYIPSIIALILGTIGFFMDKQKSKKAVQLIFLLTILSLSLTTYKSIYTTTDDNATPELQQKQQQFKNETKKNVEDLKH